MTQKLIFITGTPGTGKTTLAKKLAQDISFNHINLGNLIKINKWHEGYDRKTQSYVVDETYLRKKLSLLLKNCPVNTIIDTHLTGVLGKNEPTLCIVCVTDIKVLKRRLVRRKYAQQKIRDNLDSEIFEVCKSDAQKRYKKIIVYDSSKPLKLAYPQILKKVKTAL